MEDDEGLALLQSANKDSRWFSDNYKTILKEHDNQFVAVKNCQLVAFAPNFEGLIHDLEKKKINPALARIKYISSTPRIFF